MNGDRYTYRFMAACAMVVAIFAVQAQLIIHGNASAAAPVSAIFGGAAMLLAVGKLPKLPGGPKGTGGQ